jgi:lysophospholipase L1-like esterase
MPPTTPVSPLDIIVFVGDSITEQGWFNPAVAAIDAGFVPRVSPGGRATGAVGVATGKVASVTPTSFTPSLQVVNSGESGDGVQNIVANVATRITAFNPTLVVLEVGVNDCLGDTDLGLFTTDYNSILDQTIAANPGVKIMCVPIITIGEQWKTVSGVPQWNDKLVPPPSNPTFTPWIDDYNAVIQAACTRVGANYVETRNEYLAYESTHNTPQIGSFDNVLTLPLPSNPNGVHPNSAGQVFLGNIWQTHLVVSQP